MSAIPLTPKLALLHDMIVNAPSPIGSATLAERYGCTQDHVLTMLRRLRARGLVAPTSSGRDARWTIKAIADAEREQRQTRREYQRTRQQSRRLRLKLQAEAANHEWVKRGFVHVIVPAHSREPVVRPPAPASVFNLARCAA